MIWSYEDYVARLKHPDSAVRRWAFRGLEERFPNRFTPEVECLIGDENEHLACMAPKYLARHGAQQDAEKILACFQNSVGNVRSNCAEALGTLEYKPASARLIEHFQSADRGDSIFGLLHYFAKVDLESCREILRAGLSQLSDPFELGLVSRSLLQQYRVNDVKNVAAINLDRGMNDKAFGKFMKHAAEILGSEEVFQEITHSRLDILDIPAECLNNLLEGNPSLSFPKGLLDDLTTTLNKGRYSDFTAMALTAARVLVKERYREDEIPDWLGDTHKKDLAAVAFLEVLNKRSGLWSRLKGLEFGTMEAVACILAVIGGMLERENHLAALAPDSRLEDLLLALKRAGKSFPKVLRKRIIAARPIDELGELLTGELFSWGDIWVVRLMGKIGSADFTPSLIRVLRESDSLSFIHEEAIRSLQGLDCQGDELVFSAIKNKEVDDWASFGLLGHLAFEESFDLALDLWRDDSCEMGDYEMFAICLEGIGDPRGVDTLRAVYNHECSSSGVGRPLECLARLHNVDIPELAEIEERRREGEKLRRERVLELEQIAARYQELQEQGIDPFAQKKLEINEGPKVGRNDPCPCGSGIKYKKCCLGK